MLESIVSLRKIAESLGGSPTFRVTGKADNACVRSRSTDSGGFLAERDDLRFMPDVSLIRHDRLPDLEHAKSAVLNSLSSTMHNAAINMPSTNSSIGTALNLVLLLYRARLVIYANHC